MSKYSTVPGQRFGLRVLDPLPTREELDKFFAEQYYELVNRGERAVDIARTRRGGAEATEQEIWFRDTVHRDIIDILQAHAPGKRVAEVGCGLGNLVNDMKQAGLEPFGIDLATAAVETVRSRGLEAMEGSIDTLVEAGEIAQESLDAVIFNNVLELTFDPVANLQAAARSLKPDGVLLVRGGNDFNDLQMAAVEALGLPEWWVSPPEHINYLSFDAVEAMMVEVGVAPFHRHGEFPMELWLLLGFDYISDRSLGAECHKRRVAFEQSIPVEVRRKLYKAFGAAGMGRTMVVAGRRG